MMVRHWPVGGLEFGKGESIVSAKTGKAVEILRSIINLMPSNSLFAVGKPSGHFHFTTFWAMGSEVIQGELLWWKAEEIDCVFYMFKIPGGWLPSLGSSAESRYDGALVGYLSGAWCGSLLAFG